MQPDPTSVEAPAVVSPNNPRRPPAHRSVSLRHNTSSVSQSSSTLGIDRQSTALASPPSAASDKANPPSTTSPNLLSNKYSSGESSDAGKWFEATNNTANNASSFIDNDPPLLLYNSSSSSTPPEAVFPGGIHPRVPLRPVMTRLATDSSSNGDFRSVIDDLTIANKKLKQKLRQYEKVHDAHMEKDKLFEVKFHGLPHHKKKELEETLRKFAAGLDGSGDMPEMPSSSYAPMLNKETTGSSMSRFAESGYASMSASGQHSSALSNQTSNLNVDNSKQSKSAYNRQQQSIQSYLHDIPRGLLGENNTHMSDKSRKKMVVRRLEQIFAGKRSTPGGHPHPMQQEEVAQSAATADRREREATGRDLRPEGLREALIMSDGDDDDEAAPQNEALQQIPALHHVSQQDFAGTASPNQRPTRPLDLDPYRAQVPVANMNYIRHLGFSPPDMRWGNPQEVGHGWLYLNLLINMAQLHTLNVTPDFVKDALVEYSTMLELSNDGRRVRWRGGLDLTKDICDSSPEYEGSTTAYNKTPGSRSPLKRTLAETSGESSESYVDSEHQARKRARAEQEARMDKFMYKPVVFRGDSSSEDAEYGNTSIHSSASNSYENLEQNGDSSGLGSSTMPSAPRKNRHDDGPIIFYRKAKFCTDLTGDRPGASLTNPEAYRVITNHPVGALSAREPGSLANGGELRAFLTDCFEIDSKDGSQTEGTQTPSSAGNIGFSPNSLMNDARTDNHDVMDFKVSGLGGVQPEDNFCIQVQRSQVPTMSTPAPGRRSSIYPKNISDILNEHSSSNPGFSVTDKPQPMVKQDITSASHKNLPSSKLPEASFLQSGSPLGGWGWDSDSGSDSDTGSDISSEAEPTNSENGGPSTSLHLPSIQPKSTNFEADLSDEPEDGSDYSDDSDESIDLLATARQQDPATIRAYEREYDAAIADRLAEEIVAGSSAATAGGGSGFNTPADGRIEHIGSAQKLRPSPASDSASGLNKNMKRTRTSESVLSLAKTGSKGSKSQRTK
jgi:hypothetical protein